MGSIDTKLLIAQSFIGLVEQEGLQKVSVSNIVERSQRNRKTFYYHFSDRSKLIQWIFRYGMAEELKKRVREDELVYPKNDTGDLARLPYYTFTKEGVRSINADAFFEALDACFRSKKKYYADVLSETGIDSLSEYLFQLYVPALRNDIEFILSNRFLNEANQQFLAEFYTGAFITYYKRRICEKLADGERVLADMGPFSNIIHSSIASEINAQQRERML
ncbi:MAG: TetR/AcrR family transcriptional regulator C-terminal domain-containing protein [Eggerthellaceae bacterium]|nr:TetR/AcrR family transcriptional regulator C-terminal domain-containing protein [Eggerthellaceae bacterium]